MDLKRIRLLYVSFEKRLMTSGTFHATPEDLNRINDGENPFFEQLSRKCTDNNSDIDYDYSIINEENGKTMIDWD